MTAAIETIFHPNLVPSINHGSAIERVLNRIFGRTIVKNELQIILDLEEQGKIEMPNTVKEYIQSQINKKSSIISTWFIHRDYANNTQWLIIADHNKTLLWHDGVIFHSWTGVEEQSRVVGTSHFGKF